MVGLVGEAVRIGVVSEAHMIPARCLVHHLYNDTLAQPIVFALAILIQGVTLAKETE